MPSAVAFLPLSMSELVNFATSLSLNFGSGMIFRLGTSRRRGIWVPLVSGFGAEGAVRRPGAPSFNPGSAQAFGRLTPYFERLRLRVALLVELGPAAPDASRVPRTTW